jgi:hypothetical protein
MKMDPKAGCEYGGWAENQPAFIIFPSVLFYLLFPHVPLLTCAVRPNVQLTYL